MRPFPHLTDRARHSLTVEAALVQTLYAALSSLFVGALAAAALAGLIYWQSGETLFAILALALLLVGGGRAALAVSFRLRPPRDWPTRDAVRRARRAYVAGAWAFTMLLGLLGFYTIMLSDDLGGPLVICTFIAGYTAAITGRNAASIPSVLGQNLFSLLPVVAAALFQGGTAYTTLAILLLLLVYSATEIALALNRTAVRALVHGEENAALAARLDEQNATLRQREQELASQNQLFGAALANMPHGLCMFDARGRLLVANDRVVELLGLPQLARGMSARRLIALALDFGHDAGRTLADMRAEYRTRLAGGDRSRMLSVLSNGRLLGLSFRAAEHGGAVVIFEDVTEEKQAEARIAHLASHDPLTDLPNRVMFRDSVRRALAAGGGAGGLAVFCLDLDGFKSVNDTLGHPAGDALLRMVSRRLREDLDATATVGRLGGDEFAVLVTRSGDREEIDACAARLVGRVAEAYDLDGHQVVIGTSIGIALSPADGVDPDTLIKRADLALYRAKAEGRGTHRFFEVGMDSQLLERRLMELELRRAVETGAFELFYQPIVALEAGAPSGFEALIRWRHPDRGLLLPDDFMPTAEKTGLIAPLGEWVLRTACAEAARWPEPLKVAVNLSPAQFRGKALLATVVSALAASGLPAERLELEIAESVLLVDSEASLARLNQLRAIGVRIAMVDFGTGYSSLGYLRSFPFDKIKIDRSLVGPGGHAGESEAVLRALVGLGRSLGMTTTAEGVETAEQLERVRAEGCTEVQGYWVGEPLPAGSLVAQWPTLRTRPSGRGARRARG
ncbi:MAG: putative bifunctional diguanylate cyclase/phosphodiesterase [Allosphingosinicella sp.]